MRGEAKRDMEGVPIACDPAALTTEQRERKRSLQRLLGANLRELRELENGYAFRHSPEETVLLALAEFVALERLCCPFFDFGIEVGRSGGPVWFRMTGEEQAKIGLEAELGISRLRGAAIPSEGWPSPPCRQDNSILVASEA